MGTSANGASARYTQTYVVAPGAQVDGFEEPQTSHGVVITDGDDLFCIAGELPALVTWAQHAHAAVLRAAGHCDLAEQVAAITPHHAQAQD